MRRASAVADDVHGRCDATGVLDRLVERHRVPREVLLVHAKDRVEDAATGARAAKGSERRPVLDEALLAAVVPDEVRDLVHVRICAGHERREADGRQRREHRRRAAVLASLVQLGKCRSGPPFDRVLVHRGRQPVDDDQQRLSRGQGSGDLRGARLRAGGRGARARATRARGGSRAPERTRGRRGRARPPADEQGCPAPGAAAGQRTVNGRGRSDGAEHAADPARNGAGQLGEQPAHRRRRDQGDREREPEVAKNADREDAERRPEACACTDPVPGSHDPFECTHRV